MVGMVFIGVIKAAHAKAQRRKGKTIPSKSGPYFARDGWGNFEAYEVCKISWWVVEIK